jgi:hypothetical protein
LLLLFRFCFCFCFCFCYNGYSTPVYWLPSLLLFIQQ